MPTLACENSREPTARGRQVQRVALSGSRWLPAIFLSSPDDAAAPMLYGRCRMIRASSTLVIRV